MIITQFARLIAHFQMLLHRTDEGSIDPDDAIQFGEFLDFEIEKFDHAFLREYADAFALIAPEYGEDERTFVRDIPYYSFLEEAIAADDPVKLMELQALRDARDDAEPPVLGW